MSHLNESTFVYVLFQFYFHNPLNFDSAIVIYYSVLLLVIHSSTAYAQSINL